MNLRETIKHKIGLFIENHKVTRCYDCGKWSFRKNLQDTMEGNPMWIQGDLLCNHDDLNSCYAHLVASHEGDV